MTSEVMMKLCYYQ